ncbi:MAG TPA: type II secretion system protein [Clostridiales bacterium]|nr:type II secretion system protein [Clostridiales bacterium]HQP69758.1 type II secretion system protein [Clostridiales bacterium]
MRGLKAFTLIEVLVTATILVIAIVGMLSTFIVIQNIIIDDTHRYNASLAVNQVFEEIQSKNLISEVDDLIDASPHKYLLPTNSGDMLTQYDVTLSNLGDIPTSGTGLLKYVRANVTVDNRQIFQAEMLSSVQE